MTFSKIGRILTALVATAALGLGMTACGGGTIGYMWVLGTYYNQITGFKIDDYTGNLTAINHSPFSSGGSNPQTILVKPGGRFVYVINSGSGGVGAPTQPGYVAPAGAGISVFAVGGDGILTYQQTYFSQGINPIWATLDSSGQFLYVVDKYSPYYGINNPTTNKVAFNGSITAFSIASDTGRLTLVTNAALLVQNVPINVFEVGPNPIMTKVGSGNCLFTLEPKTINAYTINSSNGQLTQATTAEQQISGASTLSSINTSLNSSASGFIYITDSGNNSIYSYTAGGSNCTLSPVSGSQQTNVPGAVDPVNSFTSASGGFLYVINQMALVGTQIVAQSNISAFKINTNGQLQTLGDGTNNPYSVGSGPVCIVADPTNQYLFISNNTDSTVTGKLVDQAHGFLSDLQKGSVFPVSMKPSCLVVSGSI